MHDPLVRKRMPPGWIDLAVGEAHIVRKSLQLAYPKELFNVTDVATGCDYQAPEGYTPLVGALEHRHAPNARVVITSGAKQGLLGVFYALRKLRGTHISMRSPYWSQMPEAIALGGLGLVLGNEPTWGASYMIVSPNNPDGHITTPEEAAELQHRCDKLGTFLIHDAAYHTPIYLRGPAPKLAQTTVYSVSKSYGLSGLRVGYVVTEDARIWKLVSEYVEASSVGVSVLSQQVFLNIIQHESQRPSDVDVFQCLARGYLQDNKKKFREVNPEVLDTSDMSEHGIFGWFKPGPKFNPEKARIRIPPGVIFGDTSRVRVNLALEPEVIEEVVRRLNAAGV